jgi:aminoglycoside phosphotransferase (APT) family kinase protein
MHRREASIAAGLPDQSPTPRLLWTHENEGWVALVFEDVEGRAPEIPWDPDELNRVIEAIKSLSDSLTPTTVAAPPIAEAHADTFTGWRALTESEDLQTNLDPWARDNLAFLISLEENWETAASGETLVHADIRADNIILTDDHVVFVDWPHACIGAKWLDLFFLLPSVAMQGGPDPWDIFDEHPLATDAPHTDVVTMIAALAGYFIQRSLLTPPPGIPRVREFQRLQGEETLAWLRRRLDYRESV